MPKPDPGVERIEDPAPGEDMVRFGLFLDLARLALETDLTRIATVYFVGTTKTPSYSASYSKGGVPVPRGGEYPGTTRRTP